METEEERREQEVLKTKEDYLELLEVLNDSSQNIEGNQLDDIIMDVSKGLRAKIGLILDESERYTRKQSWWSKMIGRHKKKIEERKLQKEEQKNKQDAQDEEEDSLRKNIEEYNQRVKNLQQFLESKGVDFSLLLASPNDSEAKEPEVVEDNEGSGENEEKTPDADGEADCLKF